MTATKVQLTGGVFQDSEGNKLALGYLIMKLAMDANISGVGNIASGIDIRIQLDANGSVVASPAQSVWGIDQMLPVNNYYRVTGYTAAGQPAWGPNNQQVIGSGGTFDVGTWVPNQVISWVPPLQPLQLDTNATLNPNQGRLNFEDTASVTWAVDSNGNLEATADVPAGIDLQTNSVDNADQTVLNFEDTPTVTWASTAGGVVKATATVVPPSVGPRPNTANWKLWSSSGSSSANFAAESVGCVPNASADTFVSVNPTSTQPAMIELNCATTAGGSQVIFGDNRGGTAQRNYTLGILAVIQLKAVLTTVSSSAIRFWYLANDHANNLEGLLVSNNPAVNGVGFRFAPAAGDVNFQAYACTDGTHFTIVDTGIVADTAAHTFEVKNSAGGAIMLYFIDGVQVATISTNVPATSVLLGSTISVDNLGTTNAAGVKLAYSYLETSS